MTSKKKIICKGRPVILLPPTVGIERVTSMEKLGVTIQSNLSMKDHVDKLMTKSSNMIYAMNILRNHGMQERGVGNRSSTQNRLDYLMDHGLTHLMLQLPAIFIVHSLDGGTRHWIEDKRRSSIVANECAYKTTEDGNSFYRNVYTSADHIVV